jgi:hypothetical protein
MHTRYRIMLHLGVGKGEGLEGVANTLKRRLSSVFCWLLGNTSSKM